MPLCNKLGLSGPVKRNIGSCVRLTSKSWKDDNPGSLPLVVSPMLSSMMWCNTNAARHVSEGTRCSLTQKGSTSLVDELMQTSIVFMGSQSRRKAGGIRESYQHLKLRTSGATPQEESADHMIAT
eukprot:216161-Amphidinium_carterae.1